MSNFWFWFAGFLRSVSVVFYSRVLEYAKSGKNIIYQFLTYISANYNRNKKISIFFVCCCRLVGMMKKVFRYCSFMYCMKRKVLYCISAIPCTRFLWAVLKLEVQYLWCQKKCSISHACGFTDCAFPLGLKKTFPAFLISWWLGKFSAFANSLSHFLPSRKINIKQAVLYIYLYILKNVAPYHNKC